MNDDNIANMHDMASVEEDGSKYDHKICFNDLV